MASDENDITNLLHLYAEYIDSGNLEGAASLFAHASIHVGNGEILDHHQLLDMWKNLIVIYPDGTPQTRHIVTNPIIDVDAANGTATCRSNYMVVQSFPDAVLKIIAMGRYHDRFQRADGAWRFSYRDYSLLDMRGDFSRHVPMFSQG